MNNHNTISGENNLAKRNDAAEWAVLKELANSKIDTLSPAVERERDAGERDKYRRRGKLLLEIVGRMEDRPSPEERSEKLTRIHHAAERAGVSEDFDAAIDSRTHPRNGKMIGRHTFGAGMTEAELTDEENTRVEELRTRVFDLA